MKKVLPLVLLISTLLAACGAKATPTMDAASVQASAVAMAFTMSAQTAAAQPTSTPIPPSETPTQRPLPSPTVFAPLPTLSIASATPTRAAGGACNSLMDPNPGGPKVYLVIDNRTKGSLTFSLYLNETPFACGFVRGVSFIGANDNVGINVPEGCYWPSAYINDPKKPRAIEGPQRCIHGNDKITLVADYDGFKWLFP